MIRNTTLTPSGEPRLLHRVAMPDTRDPEDGTAMLTAWAGCCTVPGERSEHAGYVALEGELDRYSASLLRDPLLDFAAYAGELVIDLRALGFIDSAGVELLEETTCRQSARGNVVRLHEPQPFVRKVMRLVADAEIASHRGLPAVTGAFVDPTGSVSAAPFHARRAPRVEDRQRHGSSPVLDGPLPGRT